LTIHYLLLFDLFNLLFELMIIRHGLVSSYDLSTETAIAVTVLLYRVIVATETSI
jgi:hypothetical protein